MNEKSHITFDIYINKVISILNCNQCNIFDKKQICIKLLIFLVFRISDSFVAQQKMLVLRNLILNLVRIDK